VASDNHSIPPAFQKLKRILSLERQVGYTDRAVIGGLKEFSTRWQQEASEATSDASLLRLIARTSSALKVYSEASMKVRQAIVEGILRGDVN
jgi:hypothetical protein